MRIFNLVLTTQKTMEDSYLKAWEKGHDVALSAIANNLTYHKTYIVEQLEHLKQDHWDKEAFDRLIEWIEKI